MLCENEAISTFQYNASGVYVNFPVDFPSHKGLDFSLPMIMKLSQSTCISQMSGRAHLRQGNFVRAITIVMYSRVRAFSAA